MLFFALSAKGKKEKEKERNFKLPENDAVARRKWVKKRASNIEFYRSNHFLDDVVSRDRFGK